jgi:hypothetical protein
MRRVFDRTSEEILRIVRLNIEATLRVTHAALQRRAQGRFHTSPFPSLASLYRYRLRRPSPPARFSAGFLHCLGQSCAKKTYACLRYARAAAHTQAALRGLPRRESGQRHDQSARPCGAAYHLPCACGKAYIYPRVCQPYAELTWQVGTRYMDRKPAICALERGAKEMAAACRRSELCITIL